MKSPDLNEELINAITSNKGLYYIQDIVTRGANINHINYDQQLESAHYFPYTSIFDFAIISGDIEVVKWLKEQGAKSTEEDQREGTLVVMACHKGGLALVKWLITENDTKMDSRAVTSAAISKDLPLIKWLVEDQNAVIDEDAIFWAIPNSEIVNYLFEKGAKLKDGSSEIRKALRHKANDLVYTLLSTGGKLDSDSLDDAIISNENPDIIKLHNNSHIMPSHYVYAKVCIHEINKADDFMFEYCEFLGQAFLHQDL
jgi:hypothetical protein